MQIEYLQISLLHPHPINRPPNLAHVKWLAGRLRAEGFDEAHPIPVRKNGKGYQMAGGNQRKLAAEQIGLKVVPCIVKKLDERQMVYAIMHDNAQEPVHPIDIGKQFIHMRRELDVSIKGFAKEFKMTRTKVRQFSEAATVYHRLKGKVNEDLRPVWKQLAVIYGAGQTDWQGLAERALGGLKADCIRQILKDRKQASRPLLEDEEDDGDVEREQPPVRQTPQLASTDPTYHEEEEGEATPTRTNTPHPEEAQREDIYYIFKQAVRHHKIEKMTSRQREDLIRWLLYTYDIPLHLA
jgi:ParB/RepB/Spo0J family partition protein